ncbi:serine/threonine-protein kinase H1-like [Stegastes partitus]|uniref:Serine/threonine-protein kinase H1-like n=1 Tax=Stegastes partitus TaxID=144197 RepID=A0A9Y4N831_9TELE|nr:PREDICTED: serine/threonine-protein kinase H1-like [Stegastes partitus]
MGCGNSKVLPEASKKGYVSVVQSLVVFSKRHEGDEPKKHKEKRRGPWFSNSDDGPRPTSSGRQQFTQRRERDKAASYKDTFEPRVTARYDIKALIGRGSFSRVVRAEHRATRQPFAIKMMEVAAPRGREVCASELAVLQRVNHANVIQLIEVFQFPRRVYAVLELATGGELLDRVVSRGHFTERDATRALQMVLAGVGHLHNLGVTHRDLKPENLLYYHPGADSRLLVTDFGSATFGGTLAGSEVSKTGEQPGEDRSWSLRTTCGTPEYMAPEVLLRKPYTCAVDMWALGVIAYIVLSGSMPFEDDNRTRLYKTIVRGKYSFHGNPWPSVSNLAKDFIARLLVSDPAARLTADQAIRHPWVVTMAAGASMRNLHRSISQNLRQRASRGSSRCPSSGDAKEKKPTAAAVKQSSWNESDALKPEGIRSISN